MKTRLGESAWYLMFLLSLLLLAYVAGSLTTLADIFPSTYIRNAYAAATALIEKRAYARKPLDSNLWVSARTPLGGVTVHDPERTAPGLTLYTSGHESSAILIDMDGNIVHEWERPYHDIWDASAAVRNPVSEQQIYFRKAHAFPNGDLLAIQVGVGDTPWGYGMVKLDMDSNVIWKNLERFHHDFAIAGDGRIYGLTHEFRRQPIPQQDHLRPPLLEDFLVILSPDGRTLRRISLLDALNRSPYARELWRIEHFTLWDPLHTNNVDILDDAAARALRHKLPMARPGQVLLGFRELDGGTIALLDTETEEIVWAQAGAWKSMHDPDVLPNGNILIFDNLGNFGSGSMSRVIEIDPATGGIIRNYSGGPEQELTSEWRSAQQPLPNGNILITESNGSRILEVDAAGDTVWEFINPVRRGKNAELSPVVSWASRLDPNTTVGDFRARLAQKGVVPGAMQGTRQ